ncbi:MAG: Ig-like domain-containing protein, partial [Segetibacter sp.]
MKNSFTLESTSLRTAKSYFRFLHSKWFLFSMLLLFAAGCKKVIEETSIAGICPTVILTSPVDTASGVLLNKRIDATFSKAMNPTSLTNSTFMLQQGSVILSGKVTMAGTMASFTPTNNLTPNTLYSVIITTGAQDPEGNALVENYLWDFTTGPGPDVTPPTVTSTDPVDASISVAFNKMISANFSEVMDSVSISTSTFTIENTTRGGTAVAGTVSYTGTTAVFSPSADLLPNTTYTGTITTKAKDKAGNGLAYDYIWSFTTGAVIDVVPPTVILTDPANLAISVPFNKKVNAAFSEAMDPATITTATFTLKYGTTDVAGVISYTGTMATFTPSANLLENTIYTGTITKGAKDLAGNAMVKDYVWFFTTGSSPDATLPTVTSTDPVNTATGVAYDKKVTANFSEAMDPLTITTTNFIIKSGATTIPGTVLYTGTTAVFSPSDNLAPGTTYTGTIKIGATDLAGNALASDYVWSFTTAPAPDVTRPTVIATDPVNTATGVMFDKKITASFSEAMDPLTITGLTFTIDQGGIVVPGTITYAGTVAMFSPATNLAPNTTYTGTIKTGAKDLAGNSLLAAYVWSFTTGLAPDVIPPTVISTDPMNAAIGVVLDKKIMATFSEAMNPLTINATTFLLSHGATGVFGLVTYAGNTATFSPATTLLSNTVYTATIKTAAKDLAGNSIITDYIWSFTTLELIPPPSLGTASIFGAFGGSAGITNQGLFTVINNGSIGTTGASTLITGFHDGATGDVYTETPLNIGNVKNRIYTAPPAPGTAVSFAVATLALLDANIAYNSISPASKPGGIDPGAGELGGLTLAPGIYKSASGTFKITNGDLTLDAKGDPNAVWIFQTGSSLTVGTPTNTRNVNLIGGAQAKNVFWHVGSAATINGAGGGTMVGNIIASAGVTFSTAGNVVLTVLNGRALSL